MAVFRVNKTKDYTSMSNYHFKDNRITLKAKGLLSQMLSLPDNWDYSIQGLVAINKENEVAIKGALDELKQYNYLVITKLKPNQTKSGRIEYVYDIYEKPKKEKKQEVQKQGVENLGVEILDLENQGQLNTNKQNTKNKKTNNNKEIYKESYGTYKRIKLTTEEYLRLVNEYGEDFIKQQIELLDEYIEINNNKNKYTNFNLVLRKSIRENWFKNSTKGGKKDFTKMMKEIRDKYD